MVLGVSYTTRNAQVAAILLLTCCFAVIKPISGCIRIVCLSTGLLQVDCQDFLSTSLMQVVSTTCSKSVNIEVASSLVFRLDATRWSQQTWCSLMKPKGLMFKKYKTFSVLIYSYINTSENWKKREIVWKHDARRAECFPVVFSHNFEFF